MNCDEYKLSLYIDNMLTPEETRLMAQHLEECEACRKQYGLLMDIKEDLSNFPEVELPDDFHKEAMARLRKDPKEHLDFVINRIRSPKREWSRRISVSRFGTVAAGLLITLLLFSGISSLIPTSGNYSTGEAIPYPTNGEINTYSSEMEAAAPAPTDSGAATEEGSMATYGVPEAEKLSEPQAAEMRTFEEADLLLADKDSARNASPAEQFVKTYNIDIEAEDFDAVMAVIAALPGYNVSSEIYNHSRDSKSAYLNRMVDAGQYEYVKSVLKSLGHVNSERESVQRVYLDIADIEARTRAKETEIDRLYELLERSDTVAAMVAIEQRLEATSYERDQLRSQYLSYTRDVSSPRLTIGISYRDYTPQYKDADSFGERLSASFIGSLNGTLVFIESSAVFVSSIGFPLLLICLASFVVYLVRNTLKRRHRENE